jgi:hypothetical protein
MPVPPKVRNFWWRVIKKFIPCHVVLHNRHMEPVDFCHACGKEETIAHVLFKCTWAKLFWTEVTKWSGVKIPKLSSSWAIDMLYHDFITTESAAIILCGAWSVWSSRNSREHGESAPSVSNSVRWVMDVTLDLSISGKENSGNRGRSHAHWLPPDQGVTKINVDASFTEASHEGATGAAVRGHDGQLIRAQALWYSHTSSAFSMEAIAIRDGVRLACGMGLQHVIIESDAQTVVQLWKNQGGGRSEIAGILHEIDDTSKVFQSFTVRYIGREANQLAHLCAARASSVRRRCLWINYTPLFLASCLQTDCNSPS